MGLLNAREEAAALLEYHRGETRMAACIGLLSQQFQVIQTRSQLLLSLSALVLTITGFSGPKIAATNLAARLLMVGGISLTLISIIMLLLQGLTVRWSTQIRGATEIETLQLIIENRNKKTTWYFAALILLIFGLGSYVASVVVFLLFYNIPAS